MEFLAYDDFQSLITYIVLICIVIALVSMILNFFPQFMKGVLSKLKKKSMIYRSKNPKLLGEKNLGLTNLIKRKMGKL